MPAPCPPARATWFSSTPTRRTPPAPTSPASAGACSTSRTTASPPAIIACSTTRTSGRASLRTSSATRPRRTRIASDSRDPVQRVLVPAGDPSLREDAMPDGDLHQSPQGPARIASPLLLTHEGGHAFGLEPPLERAILGEQRGEPMEQVAVQPLPDGHEEAALAAPHIVMRQTALGPAPEHTLARAPRHLRRVGEGEAELDHAVIDEGHATLDPEPHEHAIELHEQIVRQTGHEIHVLAS